MKTFLNAFSAMCMLCLCADAMANMYRGTITQTVTSTSDPLYHVGQIVTGWYEYESDTLDGSFAALNAWDCVNPEAEKSLAGNVFAFCGYDGNGLVDIGSSNDRYWTQLTVVNGLVSFFYLYGNLGSTDYDYWTDNFMIQNNGMMNPRYVTRGSLDFSGPELVPVPDVANTFGLLGAALLAALAFRRRGRFRLDGPQG